MASLRDIRKRIKTVKNTQKITKAMKMVSAAKLRRAQERVEAARPFRDKVQGTVAALAKRAEQLGEAPHPLLQGGLTGGAVEMIVMTSDRGLCGGFNSNAVRKASAFHFDERDRHSQIHFSTIGRKGDALLRLKHEVRAHHPGMLAPPDYSEAKKLANEYCQRYIDDELDGIFLIYNEFKGELIQKQLLPILPVVAENHLIDYEYEPGRVPLMETLLPQHLATELYVALLETVAAEHLARMLAMVRATKNAGDMVDSLTLKYNRARQAAITTELGEIISGSEAIK